REGRRYFGGSFLHAKLVDNESRRFVSGKIPDMFIYKLHVHSNVFGDIMTSVTILSYDFNNVIKDYTSYTKCVGYNLVNIIKKSILNEVCRDYSNVWCTSVCALSKSHFLVSDMESNFLVLQKSNIRYNDEDSFKLSMVSQFNHGSVVNKMLSASLTNLIEEVESRDGILRKNDSILCASSEGSICALIPFSNFANFKRALCIEIALNDNISSIGNLSHSSYREYKVSFASKCCKGIVDGELFKMFFYMPFEKQFKTYIYAKWIAKKLNCKFGTFENFMLDIENLCSFL
ncbi:CPSF (cleavage and polyadenylation specific factor), subunit A, putative, partial [Plasmodium malariae]